MRVKDLKPNPKNPRTITDAKLEQLKKAMLEFGDLSGVVYNRRSEQLVGGHQRAKNFADAEIVITKTYDKPTKTGTVAIGYLKQGVERFAYREVNWDKHREMAANIAANKGAGEWDMPELGQWMKELGNFEVDLDLDLTMFDEEERDQFGGILVSEHTRVSPTGVDEDDVPEKAPSRTRPGYIYELGDHRLMCGDSTNSSQVSTLMNGEKACITFSSPPYNVGRTPNGNEQKYLNDSDARGALEFTSFLKKFTTEALRASEFVFVNIQSLAGNKLALIDYLYAMRESYGDTLIWDKMTAEPAMAKNVLNSRFEYIHVFSERANRVIGTKPFRGTLENIFQINSRKDKEFSSVHKATFPVGFAQHFVEHFSKTSVLDLFGGTGTTMIAAEKLGRKSFTMELDTHYCDVIVERWEKYTGQKAKLLNPNKMPTVTKLRKKAANQSLNSHA